MRLKNKTVGILVEHQYQDMEVWVPYFRLKEEGVKIIFIGTGTAKQYTGKFGYPVRVDRSIQSITATQLDALIIPGGWAPDFLRRHNSVLKLVQQMDKKKKIIAAICHAGWVLASAKIVKNRTLTAFSAIKDDLIHAGAKFVNQAVVSDKNLITSRTPEDLPVFCKKIIDSL